MTGRLYGTCGTVTETVLVRWSIVTAHQSQSRKTHVRVSRRMDRSAASRGSDGEAGGEVACSSQAAARGVEKDPEGEPPTTSSFDGNRWLTSQWAGSSI
jgi:hypothetical protein